MVDAIRRILNIEWNPIGCGVPEDEYDAYISIIYQLMQRRVEAEVLASHLENLETQSMVSPPNPDRNRRVAKMLLEADGLATALINGSFNYSARGHY